MAYVRVRVEIIGSQHCGIVGKSKAAALLIINHRSHYLHPHPYGTARAERLIARGGWGRYIVKQVKDIEAKDFLEIAAGYFEHIGAILWPKRWVALRSPTPGLRRRVPHHR
jgi:hypothetical protein